VNEQLNKKYFLALSRGDNFNLHGTHYVFHRFDRQGRIVALTHDQNGFYSHTLDWRLFANDTILEVW
jgi:hypothetical protein